MDLFLALTAALCIVMPLAVSFWLSSVPLANPIFFLSFYLLLGIGLKTIGLVFFYEKSLFYVAGGEREKLIDTYIFFLIFVASILAGYIFMSRRPATPCRRTNLRNAVSETTIHVSDKQALLLTASGVLVALIVSASFLSARNFNLDLSEVFSVETVYALNVSKMDRSENSQVAVSNAAITIFFFLVFVVYSILINSLMQQRASRILLACVLIIAITIAISCLIRGKRGDLLIIPAYYWIAINIHSGRVTGRTIRRIAFAFVAVAVIFSSMTALRGAKGGIADASIGKGLSSGVEQMVLSTYFFEPNVVALIMERVESENLLLGSSYLSWTFGLVPRAVWPEKPAVSIGPHVREVIFGPSNTIGGMTPNIAGEAYLNFGWAGIFVGLVFGMAMRLLESNLLKYKFQRKTGGAWIFVILAYDIPSSLLNSSFSGYITALIVKVVLIFFVVLFLRAGGWHRCRKAASLKSLKESLRAT